MIIGGCKHSEQRFNSRSAGVSSALLFISVGGKEFSRNFIIYSLYTCVICIRFAHLLLTRRRFDLKMFKSKLQWSNQFLIEKTRGKKHALFSCSWSQLTSFNKWNSLWPFTPLWPQVFSPPHSFRRLMEILYVRAATTLLVTSQSPSYATTATTTWCDVYLIKFKPYRHAFKDLYDAKHNSWTHNLIFSHRVKTTDLCFWVISSEYPITLFYKILNGVKKRNYYLSPNFRKWLS